MSTPTVITDEMLESMIDGMGDEKAGPTSESWQQKQGRVAAAEAAAYWQLRQREEKAKEEKEQKEKENVDKGSVVDSNCRLAGSASAGGRGRGGGRPRSPGHGTTRR